MTFWTIGKPIEKTIDLGRVARSFGEPFGPPFGSLFDDFFGDVFRGRKKEGQMKIRAGTVQGPADSIGGPAAEAWALKLTF